MYRLLVLAMLLACLIGCRGMAQFTVRHDVAGGPSIDATYTVAN